MEGESFHRIKRIYLLLSLAISIVLPLITISYEVETPVEEVGETILYSAQKAEPGVSTISFWKENLPNILLLIYSIGFVIFGLRFYRNLKTLISEAKKNDKLHDLPYIYVLLSKKLDPHSFLQYIFLNKEDFRNHNISGAVMEHEKAHVDQKHSLDLLFVELLHVIFWFNPVFIYIKRSVRLNHEFLADSSVIKKNYNPLDYSNILFQYSSGHHHNSLSSPISHSSIKKRIIMITKSFSLRRLILRSVVFLPVLGGCVYLFNEDIVAKPNYIKSVANNPVTLVDDLQDRKTISIKVVEDNIWLNQKEVGLDNFKDALDKLTDSWSKEEMKRPLFKIDFQNSTTDFIESLNEEYRKTKLSKTSETEFFAPSPVAPGSTVPPPPPPVKKRGAPAEDKSGKHSDRESLFSIHITGNTLKVEGKEIKAQNFSKTLDKLSEGKTDEELKKYNFRMHISDPAPGFMEKVNEEFKKSRLSRVTGHDILPPPPPMPPKADGVPPPPPPPNPVEAPVLSEAAEVERVERQIALERREMMIAEREMVLAERQKMREIENQLREDEKLSQSERKKMLQELREQETQVQRKMREVEKNQAQMEREQRRMHEIQSNMPAPPAPLKAPDPIESINELAEEGGSFYHNGKKISAKEAKNIVRSKNYTKIEINQTGDKGGKLEITDL
ncbi:MAG TPA: M56 family metallopeptidase [Christiangramia sp.]|nr:M56 family metallopeptidase [Christiangramia sp.]